MLVKYVTTWNELALSQQATGLHFQDSVESFQTAITIYEKILMHAHLQFAMADYLVSTLMIKMDEINHEIVDEQVKVSNVIDANEHLFIDITNLNSRSSGNNNYNNGV